MKKRKARNQSGKQTTAKAETSRDQRIHNELYTAIIDHRIPPGSPLQEDRLASAFGVSRTIIRKVLQWLAHERLVSLIPNKGATVAKPSADEARQVFEARRAVETILVNQVVARASDRDIEGLTKLAMSEQHAHERGKKEERLKLSGDFHRQLAVLGGNAVLASFLSDLVSRTSLIIALFESPGAVPCSHGEHLEIADALRRRDNSKATQYMDHHLRHIEAQIDLTASSDPVDFKILFRPLT